VLAVMLPGHAEARTWPYWLAAYAGLASTVPWVSGGFLEGEFGLKYSALLAGIYALPVGVAAARLSDSRYPLLALEFAVLLGLWIVHLLVSLGFAVRKRGESKSAER
jgi:hypothetical protein